VESEERGGHPKSTRNEVKIATVASDLLKNDRRIASRLIAESFYMPKTVVLRILKEDLGTRNLCVRCVTELHGPSQLSKQSNDTIHH
jgi:hypothetical protein